MVRSLTGRDGGELRNSSVVTTCCQIRVQTLHPGWGLLQPGFVQIDSPSSTSCSLICARLTGLADMEMESLLKA